MLVLVKHSLPAIDPAVEAAEWRLGEEGRVRCQALAMRLRDYAPNAIVASTEPKAVETARLVGEALSLDVELDKRLREQDRTGTPWLDGEEFQRSVQEAFTRPDQVVFGRESIADAQRRFSAAADQPGSAVVAHGTVISAFVGVRTGIDPFELWRRLGLPAIVVLDGSKLVEVVENV